MLSRQNGHELCARALIEKGAEMEKPDNHGFTPLLPERSRAVRPSAAQGKSSHRHAEQQRLDGADARSQERSRPVRPSSARGKRNRRRAYGKARYRLVEERRHGANSTSAAASLVFETGRRTSDQPYLLGPRSRSPERGRLQALCPISWLLRRTNVV